MEKQPVGVKAVFDHALEIETATERKAFLDEACAQAPEIRKQVEALLKAYEDAGSFLQHSAPDLGATVDSQPGDEAAVGTRSADSNVVNDEPGRLIGPYKLLQQIGEGGMGTVFLAEQSQPVQRKVALKLIKSGMDSRQVIARFEAERQALAMMDHVNIARVLDAGATEAGLPYFVMELVHGVPITKYCDDNRLTPRERLELFVPVCNAIQHAHQKGIIHRDIKPSNVMITLYDGKPVPKVIDFGVAKATEQRLTERTLFTQYGTMVGTLEYMSPEQAEMSALGADTRSDIYSLGVMLYELLTGGTPLGHKRVREAAYAEILRMIKEEEPPRPSTRLSDSGEALASIAAQRHMEPAKLTKLMRGELDWIVMKCLEKDRNRRYETASSFAADVRRYLNDEPVQACPPSAWYRFRKFARRNKPRLTIAVGLLVVVAVLGGGVVWTVQETARRQARTADEVNQDLQEASLLWGQAKAAPVGDLTKWSAALAAAKRAQAALDAGTGDAESQQRVRNLLADLEAEMAAAERAAVQLLADLEEERAAAERAAVQADKDRRLVGLLAEVRTQKEDEFDKTDTDGSYRAAFLGYGLDVDGLTTAEAAERLRSAVVLEVAAALDDWAWERRRLKRPAAEWQRLVALARAVDRDDWRTALRALDYTNIATERDRLLDLAGTAKVSELPPASVQLLSRALRVAGAVEQAENVLREAQRRHPTDVWLNYELAEVLKAKKPTPWDEVVRFYTAARSVRPEIGHALGHALEEHGRKDEAAAVFAELTRLRPANPRHHTCLGSALRAQGKLVEAEAEHRRALELDPKFVAARNNLGIVLQAERRLVEASQEFLAALAIDPKDATGHNNLGNVLQTKGQLDEAIRKYRTATHLDDKYASAHSNLGAALTAKKQLDEAIQECRKAIDLDPMLASAHANLGSALKAKGRLDEAIQECKVAVELDPKDAKVHGAFGSVLTAKGRLDEAITHLRKAIDIDPMDALAHANLGNALVAKGQTDDAILEYKKAIDLDPKLAMAHANLGVALKAKGQLDEAIQECKKAVDLDPADPPAHYNLGVALHEKGRLNEAITEYQEAIHLDPKFAKAHCNLGDVLTAKGRLDEAITHLDTAIDLDPMDALAHANLGLALKAKGRLDESIRELKKAVELEPKLALAHGVLGEALLMRGRFVEARAATRCCLDQLPEGHPVRNFATRQLQQCERLLTLDEKLPPILEGKEKPADAAEHLALAQLCQKYKKRYAAAARFYAEAFEEKPERAKDLRNGHRYDAACAAALAGCGQGEDADKLDDKERTRLRQQALNWLKADLALWAKIADNEDPKARAAVQRTLQTWQTDADLACFRDKEPIEKLPEPERARCQMLWTDVDALLARVKSKAKEAPPDKP